MRHRVLQFSLVLLGATVIALIAHRAEEAAEGPAPLPDRDSHETPRAADPSKPSPPIARERDSETATPARVAAPARGAGAFPTEREPLVVVVRTPAETPIDGAEVKVLHRPGDESEFLDADWNARVRELARRTTGAEGRATFKLEIGRPFVVEVDAGAHGSAQRDGVYAGETVVVHLEAPARLTGRVTSAASGEPVAQALVQLVPRAGPDGRRGRRREGRSDENGLYSLDRIEPGRYALRVEPRRHAPTRAIDLSLAAGEIRVLDVAVEPGDVLRGVVLAAESRAPLPGAEVSTSRTFRRASRADERGRFVLEGVSRFVATIHARAPGRAEAAVSVRERLGAPPPNFVEILLEPARAARGRVVDGAGRPLAGAYVAAAASLHDPDRRFLQHIDWCAAQSGEDGRFELEGLNPRLRHVLVVRTLGRGSRTLDFPEDEFERPIVELGDVVVPVPAELGGRVADTDLRPLPGSEVVLRWRPTETNERPPGDSTDGYVRERRSRTDARGRFLFRDLEPAVYVVEARLPGLHEPAREELTLTSGERRRDLLLTLDAGAELSGRVVVSDGGALPKTYLSIDPEHGGRSADVEAEPDGRFFVRGLSPGTYRVTAYPYPSEDDRRAGREFAPAVLAGVPAGARDVEIRLVARLPLGGRVLEPSGAPAAEALVRILPAGDGPPAETRTDAEGRFAFPGRPAGEVLRLEVFPRGATPGEGPPATREVRPGDRNLEIVLPR